MGVKKYLAHMLRSLCLIFEEEKKIPIPRPIDAQAILDGKVALITGGSSGIGLAMAESFLKSGAKVINAGINEEKLRSCCEKIHGGGSNLSHIVIDVKDV